MPFSLRLIAAAVQDKLITFLTSGDASANLPDRNCTNS
jgi:hypothetical protein